MDQGTLRAGRVMVVISSRIRRGGEVFGHQLANGLADLGWWSHLVSLTDDDVEAPIEATPAAGVSKAEAGRFNVSITRGLHRLVSAEQPDVVVAYGGPSLRYVATLATRLRRPRLVYVGIGEPTYWIRTERQRRLHGSFLRLMDRCFAVASATAQQLVDDLGVPEHRVAVTPTGVPARFFADAAPDRDQDTARETTRFVFVGSLSPEKDPLVALEAFEVCSRSHDARLRFVGDGPLRADLEATVTQRGIEHVEFVGLVADVRPHLAWADALVLTSQTEGLPGVVLEAAATGLPSIAFEVGGLAEAIVDGETGLLVPPGDFEALGAAMARSAADRPARLRMGAAARSRAQERFTIEAAVGRYHQELLALTGESRHPAAQPRNDARWRIREAATGDTAAVARLIAGDGKARRLAALWRLRTPNASSRVYVLEDATGVAGCVLVEFARGDAAISHLNAADSDPDRLSALVRHAIDEASSLGYTAIATVDAGAISVRRVFEQLGFTPAGEAGSTIELRYEPATEQTPGREG